MGSALSQVENINRQYIKQGVEKKEQAQEQLVSSALNIGATISKYMVNNAVNKELRQMQQDFAEFSNSDKMFYDEDGNYVTDPSQISANYNNWVNKRLEGVNGFIREGVSSAWKANDSSYFNSAIANGMKIIDQNRANAASEYMDIALTTNYDGQDTEEAISMIRSDSDYDLSRCFTEDQNVDLKTWLDENGLDNATGLRMVQFAKGLKDLGYSDAQIRQTMNSSRSTFAIQTLSDNAIGAFNDELNGNYNIDGYWQQLNEFISNNEIPRLGRKLTDDERISVLKSIMQKASTIESAYKEDQNNKYREMITALNGYESNGGITTSDKFNEMSRQFGFNVNTLSNESRQTLDIELRKNDLIAKQIPFFDSIQGLPEEELLTKIADYVQTLTPEESLMLDDMYKLDDTGFNPITSQEFINSKKYNISPLVDTASGKYYSRSEVDAVNAKNEQLQAEEETKAIETNERNLFIENIDLAAEYYVATNNDDMKSRIIKRIVDSRYNDIMYAIPSDMTPEEAPSTMTGIYEEEYAKMMSRYGIEDTEIPPLKDYSINGVLSALASKQYDIESHTLLLLKEKYGKDKIPERGDLTGDSYIEGQRDNLIFDLPTAEGFHREAEKGNTNQEGYLRMTRTEAEWKIVTAASNKDMSTMASWLWNTRKDYTKSDYDYLYDLVNNPLNILDNYGIDVEKTRNNILKSFNYSTDNTFAMTGLNSKILEYVHNNIESLKDHAITQSQFEDDIRNIASNYLIDESFLNSKESTDFVNTITKKSDPEDTLENVYTNTLNKYKKGIIEFPSNIITENVNRYIDYNTSLTSSMENTAKDNKSQKMVSNLIYADSGLFDKGTLSNSEKTLTALAIAMSAEGYDVAYYDAFETNDEKKESIEDSIIQMYSGLDTYTKSKIYREMQYVICYTSDAKKVIDSSDGRVVALQNGKILLSDGEVSFEGHGKSRAAYIIDYDNPSNSINIDKTNVKAITEYFNKLVKNTANHTAGDYQGYDPRGRNSALDDAINLYVFNNSDLQDRLDLLKKQFPNMEWTTKPNSKTGLPELVIDLEGKKK